MLRRTCPLGAAILLFAARAASAETAESPAPEAKPTEERTGFFVGNVLGAFVLRVSFDLGAMAAPHTALVASFHAQALTDTLRDWPGRGAATGMGAELGGRLYSDRDRPSGAFIGASGTFGRHVLRSYTFRAGADDMTVTSTGVVFDIGWSFVTKKDLVVAIGAGVGHLWGRRGGGGNMDFDDERDVTPFARFFVDGWQPRVLLGFGRAF